MKFLGPPQSGSSQGDTSSRSRFGQYYRSRRAPVNPNSQAQNLSRSRLAAGSQAWRGLTEAARASWTAAAASAPRVDALGQSVTLTGAQYYIGLYALRLQAGLTGAPTVPTSSPPIVPPYVVAASSGAQTCTITLGAALPALTYAIVDCSPQVSAGVSFVQDIRFISVFAPTQGPAVAITSAYISKYGAFIASKKIRVRVRYYTAAGGVSVPLEMLTIVA